MTRADSPILRLLVALCVLAQVAMTMLRSGDRVLCFGAPTPAAHACSEQGGTCEGHGHSHEDEESGCSHDHDRDHHRRLVDTALPHEHADTCGTCVDIRVPDDPSRPDQSFGLPPMPPPMLVAILEFPSPVQVSAPPAAPPIEPRGIPPATGLSVTRLLV